MRSPANHLRSGWLEAVVLAMAVDSLDPVALELGLPVRSSRDRGGQQLTTGGVRSFIALPRLRSRQKSEHAAALQVRLSPDSGLRRKRRTGCRLQALLIRQIEVRSVEVCGMRCGKWIGIVGLLFLGGGVSRPAVATPPHTSVDTLIETSETVLGQWFEYPEGQAQITAALVTVPPGALLPPHLHPVPLFAYVLQGELIVNYGSRGERVYRRGAALVEAIDWPHQGRNGGRGIVKLLVVYAGAEGISNTEPSDLR